jgi:hypothetical protein
MEISIEIPQKVMSRLTLWPLPYHSWACIQKSINQYTWETPTMPMSIATLFIMAKLVESAKESNNQWIDKENMVYAYTLEYCSAIKKT